MNREIVLGFLKITLLGVLAVMLAIRIWQDDAIEQRWLDVRAAHEGYEAKLKGFSDQLAAVESAVRTGVRAAPGGIATEPPSGADPRTLPFWPSEDNILVDLVNEPRPPPDAPRGGILRYFTGSNPRNLNDHVVNEAELQERICGPVYEHLAEQSRNDPDEWVPGICNRVTASEDYREFTCYVRKGMYWHKPFLTAEERRGRLAWLAELPPQEVTADDVKFTFDIVRDPESECASAASYLSDVEAVEVIDRYTVLIRWKRSLYYNKTTTLNLLFIFPKFIFTLDEDGKPIPDGQVAPRFPQHWFNNKMCGTGPFQFAGWEPNQYIRLRRNDGWWNPDKPVLDGIDMTIVAEPAKQLALFKAGEIDVIYAQPGDYRAEVLEGGPGSVKEMVEQGKAVVKPWQAFAYSYFGWNLRLPQFREREVRVALAHLFPRDRIIETVYFGLAAPINGPIHPWQSSCVPELGQIPFDPQKAASILDAAGWRMGPRNVREKVIDGKPVELRFKVIYPNTRATARDATLLYQKAAAEVGILVEPDAQEWGNLTIRLEDRDFEACHLGWANVWDSDPSQIWHPDQVDVPRSSNHVSYRSAALGEVIEGLKTTFDPGKRKDLWHEFQRIVTDDQPYCFAYVPTRPWFISTRVGNHYFGKLRPQDWFLPWYVKDDREREIGK